MGLTRLLVGIALIWLIYLLGQFVWEEIMEVPASVILAGHTSSTIDELVRDHARAPAGEDLESREITHIAKQFSDLNGDDADDLIATVSSEETCGSAGCMTFVFLRNEQNEFTPIQFNYAAHSVDVLDRITNGMRDIRLNGDSSYTLIWNGRYYEPN